MTLAAARSLRGLLGQTRTHQFAGILQNGVRSVSGYDLDVKNPSDYTQTRQPAPYATGKHRSNALELIEKFPIVEVDGEMAVCDGGGGALGHPVEYISLERPGIIKECIYCGTRYKRKGT